jgi:hypothetical protein
MTRRAVASQAIVVYLYEVREMAEDPLTIPPPPSQRARAIVVPTNLDVPCWTISRAP